MSREEKTARAGAAVKIAAQARTCNEMELFKYALSVYTSKSRRKVFRGEAAAAASRAPFLGRRRFCAAWKSHARVCV